jgi:hypothetical protein
MPNKTKDLRRSRHRPKSSVREGAELERSNRYHDTVEYFVKTMLEKNRRRVVGGTSTKDYREIVKDPKRKFPRNPFSKAAITRIFVKTISNALQQSQDRAEIDSFRVLVYKTLMNVYGFQSIALQRLKLIPQSLRRDLKGNPFVESMAILYGVHLVEEDCTYLALYLRIIRLLRPWEEGKLDQEDQLPIWQLVQLLPKLLEGLVSRQASGLLLAEMMDQLENRAASISLNALFHKAVEYDSQHDYEIYRFDSHAVSTVHFHGLLRKFPISKAHRGLILKSFIEKCDINDANGACMSRARYLRFMKEYRMLRISSLQSLLLEHFEDRVQIIRYLEQAYPLSNKDSRLKKLILLLKAIDLQAIEFVDPLDNLLP